MRLPLTQTSRHVADLAVALRNSQQPEIIEARWRAPSNIRALTTTRIGGVSSGVFAGFNLGTHVGDDPAAVARNRQVLQQALALPAEPFWLTQVHGTDVTDAASAPECPQADASVGRQPGTVCAILTADCLPVLLCDRAGTVVAAAHCGWRSLAAGILPATVNRMGVEPARIMAWLGPAIGPLHFEVGEDVYCAFVERDQVHASAFSSTRPGKYLADIFALAVRELQQIGLSDIVCSQRCTMSEPDTFFSYRRDGECGRMASLIYIKN